MLSLNVLRRWPSLAALAAASAVGGPALAQSAYSVTVLAKPSGAFSFAPMTLDDQGLVRGGMYYRSGLKFVGGFGAFGFLPAYLTQAVSWSGTAATATATLGGKYLFPRLSNNSGQQVGPFNKATETENTLLPEVFPSSDFRGAAVRAPYTGATTLRQGSTDTDLTALLTKRLGASNTSIAKSTFVAKGMNNAGAIAGFFDRPVSVSGEVTFVRTPLVYLNGNYTTLDSGPYRNVNPLDINDAGTVLGLITRYSDIGGYQTLPVLWVNQQLAAVGDDSLANHDPLGINNAGQVLLVGLKRPVVPGSVEDFLLPLRSDSVIWQNGTVTPLLSPNNEAVRATAMNDQGAVVGCALSATADQRSVATRPFIWKNGVMLDLAKELAAKGVSLPAGTRWGCPLAINNSGSIVTYYYTPTLNPTVTWVRLNAKP
jgi:probable HAF family extracellular repeat protein